MKRIVLTDPIFQIDYLIQRGGSRQSAVNEFAKRIGVETWAVEENPHVMGTYYSYEPLPSGLIWLSGDGAGFGTLSHECLHAIHYAMKTKRITLSDETEELFCYYLQWMVNEISQGLGWVSKSRTQKS